MFMFRLRRYKKVLALSAVSAASLWLLEHYSEANSLWSSFRIVRFARAATSALNVCIGYQFSPAVTNDSNGKEIAARSELHHLSAMCLRDMCSKNGGLFIKAGQVVASMDYLFPHEYVEVFKIFHSDAPKSSLQQLKQVLVKELGQNVDDIIEEFVPTPLGAASLAQCHKVRLKDKRTVAMKIQHPNVRVTSSADVKTIEFLVYCASWLFPSFQFNWLVEEIKYNLPNELDFINEAQNMEKFSKLFAQFPFIKAPTVHWDLTTSSVLTMEFCEGGKINDFEYMEQRGINCAEVSWKLGRLYSEMIFVNGYIHCDPHPGNVLIRKDADKEIEIIMLDHGLYTELTDEFRLTYCNLWQGILKGNTEVVRHNCQLLNAGNLYPLLASMVCARTWDSIANAELGKGPPSSTEKAHIKKYVIQYSSEITQLLATVPRDLLLIFKTNDLVRSVERSLGTRHSATGFITMSKCCVRAVAIDNIKHSNNLIMTATVKLEMYYQLLLLYLYNLWQNFTSLRI